MVSNSTEFREKTVIVSSEPQFDNSDTLPNSSTELVQDVREDCEEDVNKWLLQIVADLNGVPESSPPFTSVSSPSQSFAGSSLYASLASSVFGSSSSPSIVTNHAFKHRRSSMASVAEGMIEDHDHHTSADGHPRTFNGHAHAAHHPHAALLASGLSGSYVQVLSYADNYAHSSKSPPMGDLQQPPHLLSQVSFTEEEFDRMGLAPEIRLKVSNSYRNQLLHDVFIL